jgi:hypothetical protein
MEKLRIWSWFIAVLLYIDGKSTQKSAAGSFRRANSFRPRMCKERGPRKSSDFWGFGFAMVDMGNNGKIANMVLVHIKNAPFGARFLGYYCTTESSKRQRLTSAVLGRSAYWTQKGGEFALIPSTFSRLLR